MKLSNMFTKAKAPLRLLSKNREWGVGSRVFVRKLRMMITRLDYEQRPHSLLPTPHSALVNKETALPERNGYAVQAGFAFAHNS